MSKLDAFHFGEPAPTDPALKDLEENLDRFFVKIKMLFNSGLNFSDNFNCHVETLTTDATPGLVTVITHSLKRVPVGCLVIERDKAGHIYKTAKDASTYTIASDIASLTVTLVIL